MSVHARIAIPFLLAGALALGGCQNMDRQTQRLLSGGAIGAAAGATVTIITGGCVACGAALGGAVGTTVGHVAHELERK